MIVTEKKVPSKLPLEFGVLLQSDIHVGGRNVDYRMIEEELKFAHSMGYRININGDVFDAILPGDRKRFRMSVLHPRLLNAGEKLIEAAVEWAYEIYSPYAESIDVIAIGNHEDAVVKHHHIDPVLMLIDRLNADLKIKGSKHRVSYGGYSGWITYDFSGRRSQKDTLTIHYHHGVGGSSPTTKGMIDFARSNVWIESADIIWRGHKHVKTFSKDRVLHMPPGKTKPELRTRYNIFTGAYGDDLPIQDQEDVKKQGRISSFPEDRLMAPQGKGGYIFHVTIDKEHRKLLTMMDREVLSYGVEE